MPATPFPCPQAQTSCTLPYLPSSSLPFLVPYYYPTLPVPFPTLPLLPLVRWVVVGGGTTLFHSLFGTFEAGTDSGRLAVLYLPTPPARTPYPPFSFGHALLHTTCFCYLWWLWWCCWRLGRLRARLRTGVAFWAFCLPAFPFYLTSFDPSAVGPGRVGGGQHHYCAIHLNSGWLATGSPTTVVPHLLQGPTPPRSPFPSFLPPPPSPPQPTTYPNHFALPPCPHLPPGSLFPTTCRFGDSSF